jgi:hypothetical protein
MHRTTVKVIHWIWSEPKLADFFRGIAEGEKIPPHGEAFEYGDEQLAAWISDFVFPEDRSRGILAWRQITEQDGPFGKVASPAAEARVSALYEELTEGRKTPAGRLEWLAELEPELVRDALLGHEGDSDIYVHATRGRYAPANRYRVHDAGTVFEPGWRTPPGNWGLPEADRQVCPEPIGPPCSCAVIRKD